MFNILKQLIKTGNVCEQITVNKNGKRGDAYKIFPRIKEITPKARKALSRSLLIRYLDVGSCNAEEAEMLALSNPIYDITRFGIDFTASPRHADVLTVSGPVTRHLKVAMERTYEAMPEPKIVVALGDGACNGSLYSKTYACLGRVDQFIPVDIYIPGDPPSPEEILKGLLLCKMLLSEKISGNISQQTKYKLIGINSEKDIPAELIGTPFQDLLGYQNLNYTHIKYEKTKLAISVCMDNTKHLNLPLSFAYTFTTIGSRISQEDLKVLFKVEDVRYIGLIAHENCDMVKISGKRQKIICGLVTIAGWRRKKAEEHFNSLAPVYEIENAVDFVFEESKKLKKRYPHIMFVPFLYKESDNRLYIIK